MQRIPVRVYTSRKRVWGGWTVHTRRPTDADKIRLAKDRRQIIVRSPIVEIADIIFHEPAYHTDDLYYFEVKVDELRELRFNGRDISAGPLLSIGLIQFRAGEEQHGYSISSLVLLQDMGTFQLPDGQHDDSQYNHRYPSRVKESAYGPGDVIGCGALWNDGIVFFTKNGAWLGEYSLKADPDVRPFPLVRIFPMRQQRGPSYSLSVNLGRGKEPFVYDAMDFHARMVTAKAYGRLGHALPAELVLMIRDHVIADVGSHGDHEVGRMILSKCTLVRRQWGAVFRPLLFEEVSIGRQVRFHALFDLIHGHFRHRQLFGEFVRKLSVFPASTTGEAQGVRGMQNAPPALEVVLASGIVHHFTHLCKIFWKTAKPASGRTAPAPPCLELALPALLRPLKRVTTLDIHDRAFRSFTQLLNIVRAMSPLTQLHLDGVTFAHRGPVRAEHLAAVAEKLRIFTFAVGSENTTKRLADITLLTHLLRLCAVNEEDAAMVAWIIETLLGSEAYYDPPDTDTFRTDLGWKMKWTYEQGAQIPGQLTLDLHGALDLLVTFRRTLPPHPHVSPAYAHVTIYHGFRPAPLPETRSFRTLLSALNTHIVSGCALVLRVKGHYEPWVPEIRDYVPELMPRAHAKGLVRVEVLE